MSRAAPPAPAAVGGRGPGAFVTLEGVDGAGKSTQSRLLAAALRQTGREVVETREPGGSPGAEAIRRLLVEGATDRWSPTTELLLFTAARRDHLERILRPALARGAMVVCDRFVDSTRAYQTAARETGGGGDAGAVERAVIDRLHEMAIGLDPDLTLILDIDPSAALGRVKTGAESRFEGLGGGFQAALRDAFRRIAEAEPGRCALIDASGPQEAVADRIRDEVARRLGLAATAAHG